MAVAPAEVFNHRLDFQTDFGVRSSGYKTRNKDKMLLNSKTFKLRLIKNRFLLLRGYLNREAKANGFPISLQIEVTNRCNLSCVTCYRKKMKRPLGDMSLSLFKKIIDQTKGYIETILLSHMGEPLLHPDIIEMIRYCKQYNLQVIIFTNITLLDKSKSLALINAGLDMLVFSIDAISKKTYEKIKKGAHYEEVMQNIETFLKIRSKLKKGPFTQLSFICFNRNKNEIKEFLNIKKKIPVDGIRVKPFYNNGGLADSIGEKIPIKKKEDYKPCIMLWREPAVCWDGTMLPCCIDAAGQEPLGNIQEKSILDVWNGERMIQLRKAHISGNYREIDLCKNCRIFQVKLPFLIGSLFLDDLSIRKINPIFERMAIIRGMKIMSHFE